MKYGYDVFGKEYDVMLRNDLHALDSIDHQFLKDMILVEEQTLPMLYGDIPCISYDVSEHELFEFAQTFKENSSFDTIRNILNFTSGIALKYDIDFLDMIFGGKEKDIINRGTDWCADMARVGCVLLQCNNIPARIVHLANITKAYNGHVVCEAFIDGGYAMCDFIYGVFSYDDMPLSSWQMKLNRELVIKCYFRDYTGYSPKYNFEGLFSEIAINEYNIVNEKNNYTESKPNSYYIKLIKENHEDKWFMGENI